MRPIVLGLLIALVVPASALADVKSDAIEACAAYLKKTDGVPTAVTAKFQASVSGERVTVRGNAPYQGEGSVPVTCKTNGGRVTAVVWG